MCRAKTAAVAADTSGMHAASAKATATVKAPSTSATATAPTSERVIRDEAGAD
jgi:hypothetical protein